MILTKNTAEIAAAEENGSRTVLSADAGFLPEMFGCPANFNFFSAAAESKSGSSVCAAVPRTFVAGCHSTSPFCNGKIKTVMSSLVVVLREKTGIF